MERSGWWYFIFGEMSVFRKRYIRLYGTVSETRRKFLQHHLDGLVTVVLSEGDFNAGNYAERGYKEIDIERD